MARLTQSIWHSNDYISIVRLVNTYFFYSVGR